MTWQPIDTAPRDGSVILLGRSQPKDVQVGYWGLAEKASAAGACKNYPWVILDPTNGVNQWADSIHGPTHWAPLPAGPQ